VPSNVEIKARIEDLESFERRAAALADGPAATIDQHDTFFVSPCGRLKLREFRDGSGELIHYERPDAAAPAKSDYRIARTTDAADLKKVLADALGVRGVVRKRRRLYTRGRTRIHADRVEGLGDFMELEVVLEPGQTPEEGRSVAEELMASLEVAPEQLVEVAYVDLLVSAYAAEAGKRD
jgi:predicted adenylyl cyclase CyaB